MLNQVLQLSKRSIIRAIKDNTSVQLPTKIIWQLACRQVQLSLNFLWVDFSLHRNNHKFYSFSLSPPPFFFLSSVCYESTHIALFSTHLQSKFQKAKAFYHESFHKVIFVSLKQRQQQGKDGWIVIFHCFNVFCTSLYLLQKVSFPWGRSVPTAYVEWHWARNAWAPSASPRMFLMRLYCKMKISHPCSHDKKKQTFKVSELSSPRMPPLKSFWIPLCLIYFILPLHTAVYSNSSL